MAEINNLDIVAIVQVTLYSILLLLTIQLFAIDGFWKSSPWLFVMLFCILRIVGGALQIASIGNPNPIHLLLAAAICSSIGLSILFLIAIELLRRVNSRCYKYYPLAVETSLRFFNLGQHAIVLTALILGIVGGVQTANQLLETGIFSTGILLEISSILFIVAFAGILGTLALAVFSWTRGYVKHRTLLIAVLLSIPILIIRLIYNNLGYIAKDIRFNPFIGSFTFYVALSFVMEALAIIIYIWGGFVNVLRRRRRRGSSRSGSGSRSYSYSRSRSRSRSRSHKTRSRTRSHSRSQHASARQ